MTVAAPGGRYPFGYHPFHGQGWVVLGVLVFVAVAWLAMTVVDRWMSRPRPKRRLPR